MEKQSSFREVVLNKNKKPGRLIMSIKSVTVSISLPKKKHINTGNILDYPVTVGDPSMNIVTDV
jgi:hypothetical protein